MITLITGVPGNGKTQKAIQLLLECISDNEKRMKQGLDPRPIFCDIAGINSPECTPLPSVEPIPKRPMYFGADDEEFQKVLSETNNTKDHYWLPPEGSIFFFDECQRVDWIKNSHGTLSKDVRTRSLETHRHRGLDFYFIAQGANYIHNHIQDLIGRHYHVERPLNMFFANVFMHNAFVSRPQTKSAKKNADDHTVLKLSKKLKSISTTLLFAFPDSNFSPHKHIGNNFKEVLSSFYKGFIGSPKNRAPKFIRVCIVQHDRDIQSELIHDSVPCIVFNIRHV